MTTVNLETKDQCQICPKNASFCYTVFSFIFHQLTVCIWFAIVTFKVKVKNFLNIMVFNDICSFACQVFLMNKINCNSNVMVRHLLKIIVYKMKMKNMV